MHWSRKAMSRKYWISAMLKNQAALEGPVTAARMLALAKRMTKCGSSTIWNLAMRGYEHRLKSDLCAKKPKLVESVEVHGEAEEDGKLLLSGLAFCKRVQCPVCCYTRSIHRKNLALAWAKERSWIDYYGVMLTFTVPHKISDSETSQSFAKVLANLFLSLKRYSTWFADISKNKKHGYTSPNRESLGSISALECTFGKNGLHPHFHTLFFTKSAEDVDKLREFFRKDRVRVWKSSGKGLNRMKEENEKKSFIVFIEPGGSENHEKVLDYVSKGLLETLSGATKDKPKAKTSRTIFELTGHALKYFCTFVEATNGTRFYRTGGICSEITLKKEREKEDAKGRMLEEMEILFSLSAGRDAIPDGLISEFVARHSKDFGKMLPQLSSEAIKSYLERKWDEFLDTKQEELSLLKKSKQTKRIRGERSLFE